MLGERRNWFIKGNREQNPILQEHFFSGMNRKTLRIWFCCLTGELYSRYTGSGIFLSGDVQLYASQGKRSRKLLTLSDFFFCVLTVWEGVGSERSPTCIVLVRCAITLILTNTNVL